MRTWLKTRLSSLFMRDRMEGELDRELAFHLDMLTEQNIRAGMSPAEARGLALKHFGRIEGVKEDVREAWLSRTAETLVQDIRYGLRNIRRNKGYAAVVVATMALGIGANTAMFSVVNGVVLQPLPYDNGDRLVVLRQHHPAIGQTLGFSPAELEDYRAQSKTLDALAEFHEMWFILLGGEEPQRVATGVVSANFFDVLGVRPALGRSFVSSDEQHGAPAVLVLSHDYWQRSFHADPGVVGRVFEMNDRPHRVIGVLPPMTTPYPSPVDVYMPTVACPFRTSALGVRDARMAATVARMRNDVTPSAVSADLNGVAKAFAAKDPAAYPEAYGFDVSVTPLTTELTRSFNQPLLVLLGTAAFVLLIVCASVANLTLARAVRREGEMTVRTALGASRLRIARQLITESTMLALIGGALGLLFAVAALDLLVAFAERFTPRAADVRIDTTVLLFSLLLSSVAGVVFGLVPLATGRLSPRVPASSRVPPASNRARACLIVAQVAVSFMLLVGAGLAIRTLYKLQQVDPGFRTENIMTLRVDLNFTKYHDPLTGRAPFWAALETRLRSIPGVIAAGGTSTVPLADRRPGFEYVHIEGQPAPDTVDHPRVNVRIVSPGYFAALEQPVLEGRVFSTADRFDTPQVVIVNHSMAQHYWPGEGAIGKRISGDGGRSWATVVGVVADTRQRLNEAPRDEVYVAMFAMGYLSSNWLVRSTLDEARIIDEIRAAVQAIDPDQPVDQFRTLADVRQASLTPPRLTATLLGVFAALALMITATGIAGVVAYSVSQRSQEFGIRMALGAGRAAVLGMVLKQGLAFVLSGLAIGTAGALILTRAMTSLLFGVGPNDILTFLSVALVLVAVAAAACFIPARRAASVDPLVALRT